MTFIMYIMKGIFLRKRIGRGRPRGLINYIIYILPNGYGFKLSTIPKQDLLGGITLTAAQATKESFFNTIYIRLFCGNIKHQALFITLTFAVLRKLRMSYRLIL